MRLLLRALATLCIVTMLGLPADAADGTQGDVAGGYSYMYDHEHSTSFLSGWFVSAGANLASMVALVGDVSGNYKSQSASAGGANAGATLKDHTFLAGPRIVGRSGAARLFGQFLVGAAAASAGITATSGSTSISASDTRTDFCYMPGAGIDIGFNPKIAMRLVGNERFIRANGGTAKQFAFEAGLVYRFEK